MPLLKALGFLFTSILLLVLATPFLVIAGVVIIMGEFVIWTCEFLWPQQNE